MTRVCVTGGAGFIGSTLADRLSVDGVDILLGEGLFGAIARPFGLSLASKHASTSRDWPANSIHIHRDCSRIPLLGWRPTVSIKEAIVRTLDWPQRNPYAVTETAPVG